MRKSIRVAAAVMTLALLAVSCKNGGGPSASSTGTGGIKEGGILRLGSSSTIDSLNPFKAFEQDAYNTFLYIYPFLVQYDGNLKISPDFASSWEWSSDSTQVTFHTVTGGSWSDGVPLTAKDPAYTLNLILKYPGPTGLESGYARHIVSATATDDQTLTVVYEAPVNHDWALSQLELIPILPQQVWSKHEGNEGRDLRSFTNDAPIVSGGPFKLVGYQKRDVAQFVRNDGYYGPKSHIDGFGLKFYTNADAEISALKNGELDAVESLPATALASIKANPNMVVTEVPGFYWDDFIINSNKPLHPELLDPSVRQAFEYAIDRKQLVDIVEEGHGTPGSTIVAPASGAWHNSDIQPLPFDPAMANQILDNAGFPRGQGGIRMANGHPMQYEVLTPNTTEGVDREFQIIQAGFDQIGVKLTQKSLDSSTLFDVMAGPEYAYPHSYDKYDMAIWDWYPLPDPDFILSVLTCQQWGFWSDTGYCNKKYDALYAKQGVTVDPAARRDIVWQMQQIAYNDRPYIVLDNRNAIEAHTKSWDGFVMSPIGSFNSYSTLTLTQVHQVG